MPVKLLVRKRGQLYISYIQYELKFNVCDRIHVWNFSPLGYKVQ